MYLWLCIGYIATRFKKKLENENKSTEINTTCKVILKFGISTLFSQADTTAKSV